jgi:hypothetical protein
MIYLAFCIAARVQSTLGPKEQKPCLSGGVTDINATSSCIFLVLNNSGISQRNIGKQSALPSRTACRALAARNNELDLKIPEIEMKINQNLDS